MGEYRKMKYKGKNNPNYGNRGKLNPIYKGGGLNGYGYKVIQAKNHPAANKNGVALEHRIVMSDHLGRQLKEWEHIHHINGIRTDNRIENLEIVMLDIHCQLHHPKTLLPKKCKNCSKLYNKPNKYFCSNECYQVYKFVEKEIGV
jgi:hypothetical protein